jgi:transposase
MTPSLSGHPKPANEVTTDLPEAKPANGVTTDSATAASPLPPAETASPAAPSTMAASVSEPYREVIESGLARGRNAMSIWQELVDQHGFTGAYEGVKRFVRKLRGPTSAEARAVITTAPGEDYGKFRVMVRSRAVSSFLAEISAASVT